VKEYVGLAAALAGLLVLFGAITDHFLTTATLRTIASQIPAAVVLASGMTLVLVVGGIDLSVGSVLALSGAVPAVVACLAAGLACGIVNGVVIARWRLPAFIVTLGMMEVARGLAYQVTDSQTQYLGGTLDGLTADLLLGITPAVLVTVLVVAVAQLALSRTVFGRQIVAIGTNEEAVRLSGIQPGRTKIAVYALAGVLASLGAILHSARLAAADPNAGAGAELQAIAAAVIGGTSLMGGRGSVIHTLLGVVIIAVLASGLSHAGAQDPTKRIITGCVIVAAAILDAYRHRGAR
jgi:ribose transport system permease protein